MDHYNNPIRKITPETDRLWNEPEYASTDAHDKLKAKTLSDAEIDALEIFLKTLTDGRYKKWLK